MLLLTAITAKEKHVLTVRINGSLTLLVIVIKLVVMDSSITPKNGDVILVMTKHAVNVKEKTLKIVPNANLNSGEMKKDVINVTPLALHAQVPKKMNVELVQEISSLLNKKHV